MSTSKEKNAYPKYTSDDDDEADEEIIVSGVLAAAGALKKSNPTTDRLYSKFKEQRDKHAKDTSVVFQATPVDTAIIVSAFKTSDYDSHCELPHYAEFLGDRVLNLYISEVLVLFYDFDTAKIYLGQACSNKHMANFLDKCGLPGNGDNLEEAAFIFDRKDDKRALVAIATGIVECLEEMDSGKAASITRHLATHDEEKHKPTRYKPYKQELMELLQHMGYAQGVNVHVWDSNEKTAGEFFCNVTVYVDFPIESTRVKCTRREFKQKDAMHIASKAIKDMLEEHGDPPEGKLILSDSHHSSNDHFDELDFDSCEKEKLKFSRRYYTQKE